MQQYIYKVAIRVLLENGVDEENNLGLDPHLIKGYNRGVLLLLNEILE